MIAAARGHLKRQVADPALRQRLVPPYPFGCKRLIYSNDFYPALAQPRVELVTDPIERIGAAGIVTADGRERTLDLLVCATGFDTVHLLSSLAVVGLDGRTLAEAWRDGPEAYHGMAVAGFPNLFLMLGPNTATGHTSTLAVHRARGAARHRLHAAGAHRGPRWIAVRPEVMRAHNEALQARLQGTVWTGCRSWYRTDSGKIVALFPGFTREYVRALAHSDPAAYQLV